MTQSTYNPDVLNCLANLSNDEVFTPPEVANAMLDMLPQKIFADKNATFLDPACKSGVFLREIAKRLVTGLEKEMPDLQERINHIFTKQLYALSITELTSLLSRRSVYCSKDASGKYSVPKFARKDGNIFYQNIWHTWQNGKCLCCGANEEEYGEKVRAGLESHAYQFIHNAIPEEIENMKFDVIIGNPPYQLSDGGAQASASPIYHYFIQQAKKLNPKFLAMIIPARWFAGGKGLDDFRNEMLNDKHIKELHDFPNTDDCFPGVNIRGGVCYFLWSINYNNSKDLTRVVTHSGKDIISDIKRPMKTEGTEIFIRSREAISIIQKVFANKNKTESFENHVSSLRSFGLRGYFSKDKNCKSQKDGMKEPVGIFVKGQRLCFVEKDLIPVHKEWIDTWKVFASRANNIGTELNDDNLNAFVGKPNEICTESVMVITVGMNALNENSAKNICIYLKTKFARFMHSLAKSSQDATSKTYRFVPLQDFTAASDIDWAKPVPEIDT